MGGAIVVEVIGRHISYEGRENALSHFCIASRCIDQGDVPIDSPSDTDRAVPQALLHDPGVDSHRDQDGSRAVAQIMETKYRQSRLMQQLVDLLDSHSL